jgi:hypothetical protein
VTPEVHVKGYQAVIYTGSTPQTNHDFSMILDCSLVPTFCAITIRVPAQRLVQHDVDKVRVIIQHHRMYRCRSRSTAIRCGWWNNCIVACSGQPELCTSLSLHGSGRSECMEARAYRFRHFGELFSACWGCQCFERWCAAVCGVNGSIWPLCKFSGRACAV